MTKISIIAALGAVVIMPTFAAEPTPAERKTTTSVNYVTRQVNTKQPKIPAAGTNASTLGTTVVTYTTTGEGQIGERGIYNGGRYSASEANKLVTAAALDGAVNYSDNDHIKINLCEHTRLHIVDDRRPNSIWK